MSSCRTMPIASSNSLAALTAFERRFDGPVPVELQRATMGGPSHMAAAANARSALFDRLARHATTALARVRESARESTGVKSEAKARRQARLARDLRLYREAGIACRDAAAELSRS